MNKALNPHLHYFSEKLCMWNKVASLSFIPLNLFPLSVLFFLLLHIHSKTSLIRSKWDQVKYELNVRIISNILFTSKNSQNIYFKLRNTGRDADANMHIQRRCLKNAVTGTHTHTRYIPGATNYCMWKPRHRFYCRNPHVICITKTNRCLKHIKTHQNPGLHTIPQAVNPSKLTALSTLKLVL